MKKKSKKLFCSHGIPIDAEHYCNQCGRLPTKKSYKQYIEMLDSEIEGYDYLLNDAIWRKEKFMESYGKNKSAK